MVAFLLVAALLTSPQQDYLPPVLANAVLPVIPVRAVSGGEVVLEGVVDGGGGVREVRVVEGAAPFLEPVMSAVRQWRFAGAELDGEAVDSQVSVTMLFRSRTIFSAGSALAVPAATGPDRAPFPAEVSDTGYPVNSTAEGVVVLELEIGASGSIDAVRVVQGSPALAATAERSVRGWTFRPAAVAGQAVAGTAIVAVSFLRPVVVSQ